MLTLKTEDLPEVLFDDVQNTLILIARDVKQGLNLWLRVSDSGSNLQCQTFF